METTTLTTHRELAPYAAATLGINCPRDSRQVDRRQFHLVCYTANHRAASESRWSVLSESAAYHQAQQHASEGYTMEVWGPAGLLAVVLPSPPAIPAPVATPAPLDPLFDLRVPLDAILGDTDAPTYAVTLVAEAPTAGLSYEQLVREAQARAWVLGERYGVTVSASTYPATAGRPGFTSYTLAVYDLAAACKDQPNGWPLGALILERSPEQCLEELGKQLRDIEQLALDAADPSLRIDAELEMYQALAAA